MDNFKAVVKIIIIVALRTLTPPIKPTLITPPATITTPATTAPATTITTPATTTATIPTAAVPKP